MNYQIGDQVIHSTYGPGKITAIDEKCLGGQTRQYYVVDTGQLTLWVRIDPVGENSIRPPTKGFEFKKLFSILRSPAEELPDQHDERKNKLSGRMNRRDLADICSVIRDLTTRSQLHNLNYNDRAVLKHAEDYLLDEWELSLGTARSAATKELEGLLQETHTRETSISE
ncbi:MAG TPA: CarD family transcriptional regulator [Anaerolineales bacterium]